VYGLYLAHKLPVGLCDDERIAAVCATVLTYMHYTVAQK